MYRRVLLVFGAAAGGLLAVGFLSAGVAFAGGDNADGSGAASAPAAEFPDVPGKDAFTIGQITFDPVDITDGTKVVEGFTPVSPLFGFAPVIDIGGGSVGLLGSSFPLATQTFFVYSTGADPTLLGIVDSNEDVANVLGMSNTEFAITDVAAAHSVKDSALPADGTVYDVFNLGHGFENVYVDVPGKDGGTVTDTLVTPFGKLDLTPLFGSFDATQPIDPGDAFTGLIDTASGSTSGLADLFSF